jgi:predicted RNA-binding protein associated with RNAse of E/G family
MEQITVRKLDHTGHQITAYPGEVLRRTDEVLVLRTTWSRPSLDLGFVTLETGSRWTEWFFIGRWFNVFEIRARDGRLRGWYCNVTRPPRITPGEVAAEDLALDLWVAPDGTARVLDEDEFAALPISPQEREAALDALAQLQAMIVQETPPFDGIRANA